MTEINSLINTKKYLKKRIAKNKYNFFIINASFCNDL